MTTRRWRNWGRTQECRPEHIAKPETEEDIRTIVAWAARTGRPVKCVGAGHSFTDIACTDGVMVSLDRYAGVVAATGDTVTVQAGITLARLNQELAARGLALENLGDITYQSVAGAISTGTHGTGLRLGNLSTQVEALRLVTGTGEFVECSRTGNPDVFNAARVSLGALGVISKVTLRCVPAFNLEAREGEGDLDETLAEMDEAAESNRHFEFFWFPHTSKVYAKRNNPTDAAAKARPAWKAFRNDILLSNVAFGAACMAGRVKPSLIPRIARDVVASQLGRVKRVAPSYEIFASPRLVRFSEMEYAVPRERAREAVRGVRDIIERRGFHVSFPVEVRFVAGDDIWLSPSFGRDTCYVAVHTYRGMDYRPYFRAVENLMMSLDGRPHWGKLHFRTADSLRAAYPHFEDFLAVRQRLDPHGRFRNAYLERVLGR